MAGRILGWLLSLALVALIVSAARPPRFAISWTSINCSHTPQYVRRIHCALQEPLRTHLDFHVVYKQPMAEGFSLQVAVTVPRPRGQPITIVEQEVDVCRFLERAHDVGILQLVQQGFQAFGNFSQGCPLDKEVAYGLFNFTLDVSRLPYAPEAYFEARFSFRLPPSIEVLRIDVGAQLELRRKRNRLVF